MAGVVLEDLVEEGGAGETAARGDFVLAGAGVGSEVFSGVADAEGIDQVGEAHPVAFVDQARDVGLVAVQPAGHLRHGEVRFQVGPVLEDELFEIGVEAAWHGVRSAGQR